MRDEKSVQSIDSSFLKPPPKSLKKGGELQKGVAR
jgi:hypothetical protein